MGEEGALPAGRGGGEGGSVDEGVCAVEERLGLVLLLLVGVGR